MVDCWRASTNVAILCPLAKYECDQCGACCQGNLIVEMEELDVMREPRLIASDPDYAGKSVDHVLDELQNDIGKAVIIACGRDRPCSFLGDDNRCAIVPSIQRVQTFAWRCKPAMSSAKPPVTIAELSAQLSDSAAGRKANALLQQRNEIESLIQQNATVAEVWKRNAGCRIFGTCCATHY